MTISRRDHYDKILENARQRLHSARVGQRTRKEILDAYRRFLKVEDRRLRILHDSGASGIDVAYRRSRLLDVVLQNLVVDALEASGSEPTLGQPLTLVAVGGYGRGLLNPRSDVDLLFLTHTSGGKLRSDVAELISQILLMLYDVGFQVGHATRSIDESIHEANSNNETKTGLIEARLLMGDQELFRRFQVQFRKQCVNGRVAEFVRHRLDDLKARHAKFSNTPFVQEPNVKQGCGGLRDYQNLIWMSYIKYNELDLGELEPLGILDRQELREIGKAYDFLHRVRNQMHYLEGRASDVLTLRLQGRVARALGYTQKGILRQIEAFMRDYYLHTRNLFHRSQELMRRWRLEEKHVVPVSRRLGHFLARRKNTGKSFDELIWRDGMLFPESDNIFQTDPGRLLRVFLHMQLRSADLSPALERLIQKNYALVNKTFRYNKSNRETFEAILSRKGEVGFILRRMHEVGLLGRYLPEFGALDCLVQHEFFHQFTADEHTLKCIEKLDELVTHKEEEEDRFAFFRKLFRDMDDPFIFYLAFLMHDAGRALGTKTHEDASALLALRVSRRWSIAPERRKFLLFLVNNHLVLFRYATQRNIDDPQVLREFIAIVKEPHYLDALYLFSFADSRGTSEQAWTSWKEMSLRRLYDMAKRYLSHGEDWEKSLNISSAEMAASVTKLLPQKMSDEIRAHFLFMPRHYFLFRTAERIASHIKLFHLYFAKIAESAGDVEPPHLHWDHREEAGLSKITLVSWDRHLLMAKLAGALAAQRINILSADLFRREDDLVLDILQVCDFNFHSVSDQGKIKRIEENVRRAFCDPDYDVEVIVQKCEPSIRNARESTGFDIARQLDITEEASGRYTVVTLQTMDRLGLLYEIFLTFGQLNLEVCHARIATEKGAAADTFYIQDHSERPVKDPKTLEVLRNKLFALVAK